MLLNSHISAYTRCFAQKVCSLLRSTSETSQGEDKHGARYKILNTKVARRACVGRAPGKHFPYVAIPVSVSVSILVLDLSPRLWTMGNPSPLMFGRVPTRWSPPPTFPKLTATSPLLWHSPQHRLKIQAGMAPGEAQEERWDAVTLTHGEVVVLASTAQHQPPSPFRKAKKCKRPSSRSGRPRSMVACAPTPHTLTPPVTLSLRNLWAVWSNRVPTDGHQGGGGGKKFA